MIDGIPVSQSTTAALAVTAPTTSFLGRTVVDNTTQTPLVGVTVTMVGQNGGGSATGCTGSAVSDAAGNFALTNLASNCLGPQLIGFNGNTVTSPAGTYAGLQLVFTLVNNTVVVSPVLVNLPQVNTAETFNVLQNDTVDQTYSFTTIPGLSVTVYANNDLHENRRHYAESVSSGGDRGAAGPVAGHHADRPPPAWRRLSWDFSRPKQSRARR